MPNASTITPQDWQVDKVSAAFLAKATLALTGVVVSGGTVDIVIRAPGVTAKDMGFAEITAHGHASGANYCVNKVVCALDSVTVTIVNTGTGSTTDGSLALQVLVHR